MVENNKNSKDLYTDEEPPLVYVSTASPALSSNVTTASPALSSNERYQQTLQTQVNDEWTCSKCTLLNPSRKLYCIACFQRHPDLVSLPSADNNHNEGENNDYYGYDDDDDDDDDDSNQGIIVETINSTNLSESSILEAQAEEDQFHKKLRRRMRRQKRMLACGAVGATTGAILCGPALLGGMVGGAVGAVGARVVSKRKERLKDERLVRERAEMATSIFPRL